MVTIILFVSRKDYLQRIFARLELMTCDITRTSLFVYVDGMLDLYTYTRNLTFQSKFVHRLCVYRKRGMSNVGSVRRRRQRIADMHNEIKTELMPTDYVMVLEDDTLFPTNALEKMLDTALSRNALGIISGLEVGRWGFDHLGAWKCNDIYNPSVIESIALPTTIQEVDATGFYCCLVSYRNYMHHYFIPLENAMGPDVEFGLALRRRGLYNLVDPSIACTHLTKTKELKVSTSTLIRVRLTKESLDRWFTQVI